ncbi:MAG: metallophosphoesterase [Nanoarchaeota archaeon]|nr:metallophosphoesterase [Nanoarchaeota archaeon]
MKVLLVTDIHNDDEAARSAYAVEKPDFVLDCGDHVRIQNLFEFTPHLYIEGNHEPRIITATSESMPLPTKILPAKMYELTKDGQNLRVGGLDGNYSSANESNLSVDKFSLDKLRMFHPFSLDVLLLHESPFNVNSTDSRTMKLAEEVREEIDRIRPKFVFSGHTGLYSVMKTPEKVNLVTLDDMHKGYGLLTLSNGEFNFERKQAFYGQK